MLTCWPEGFLSKEEAEALVSWLDHLEGAQGGPLTTEDQMAKEKLEAAIKASSPDA